MALARNSDRNSVSSTQASPISAKPAIATRRSVRKLMAESPEIRSDIPWMVHEITSSDTAARKEMWCCRVMGWSSVT